MISHRIDGSDVSEEEAAAALAAVVCLLAEEAALAAARPPLVADTAGWRGAARLIAQGLAPARPPVAPGWGRVERLRRAGRAGGGIVGL